MMDAFTIRPLPHGDAGWIISRHGAVIAREFGWDTRFEAMCARILADFIDQFQPGYEQSFVAVCGKEILGSIFLVRASDTVAKLRLLYVEPAARGKGLARKLMGEAFAFARAAGYRHITLFTTSSNAAARRMYTSLGLACVHQEPMDFSGKALTGETWEAAL